jgi:hypothetical protein
LKLAELRVRTFFRTFPLAVFISSDEAHFQLSGTAATGQQKTLRNFTNDHFTALV